MFAVGYMFDRCSIPVRGSQNGFPVGSVDFWWVLGSLIAYPWGFEGANIAANVSGDSKTSEEESNRAQVPAHS